MFVYRPFTLTPAPTDWTSWTSTTFAFPVENKSPIKIELAGYSREDIELSIDRDKVIVIAENKECGKKTEMRTVPNDIDLDSVKAVMKNGLLVVSFERKQAKKIEVE